MYGAKCEKAVKMRGLARRMRHEAQQADDSFYRRLLQDAALELEGEAERLERTGWRPERPTGSDFAEPEPVADMPVEKTAHRISE
jgi:hypothetical protein